MEDWFFLDETKSMLTCRIDRALKEQVKNFQAKYHLRTESSAIIELLRVGLFVDSRRAQLQDPALVKFLETHLYDQLLFDWILGLDESRLNALFAAFRDARELRYKDRLSGFKRHGH
jgi:hypothetical protein